MKKIMTEVLTVLMMCVTLMCFSSCSDANDVTISVNSAEDRMELYLKGKGFGDDDFLSESQTMVIDKENVYVFSWRTKEGENADKLLGMYAISFDGKSYYEYQSARGEWIKDMNASDD